MKKKKIHTFECYQTFTPTEDYKNLDECLKKLNLHYFDDEQCNYYDPVVGGMVAKYPDIEKKYPEINNAHYNILRGQIYKITVELYSDGTYKVKAKNK